MEIADEMLPGAVPMDGNAGDAESDRLGDEASGAGDAPTTPQSASDEPRRTAAADVSPDAGDAAAAGDESASTWTRMTAALRRLFLG